MPLNPGKDRITLVVANIADRPVQVGSHFHFAATNPGLEFDRAAAWGRHLDIPAGTSVRFEPGVEREVSLVPFGGARVVPGLRVEFAGALDERDHEPRPVPYGGDARSTGAARGDDARSIDAARSADAHSANASRTVDARSAGAPRGGTA